MNDAKKRVIPVRLVAVDPPFRPEHRMLFGLQDKSGAVEPVTAIRTAEFKTEIELITSTETGPDFRGVHVNGRKGDRFLYLSWGAPDGTEPFVMLARAKIKLADIPGELLDTAGEPGLECLVEATNQKGQPTSGTVKPPAVVWRLGSR